MPVHLYRIKPLSAFGTPLRSDTLHGHLLWAAAELEGDEVATRLIEQFASGEPPFVLSSAFPKGMLPMPATPVPTRREFERRFLKGGIFECRFDALTRFKAFRKANWLPVSLWRKLREGFSLVGVFEQWLLDKSLFELSHPKNATEPHNSIDRRTGAARLEGGLYFTEADFYAPGTELDMYVRTSDTEFFNKLLGHVAAGGYGRDRSTGKGHFDWGRVDDADQDWLEGQGSHRLSLSVFSAPEMRLRNGFYAPFAKHGRAWSPIGGHPFKKPFLALDEGAVLLEEDFSKIAAGSGVIRNIHADPRIVQIVPSLGAPFNLSPEEVHA